MDAKALQTLEESPSLGEILDHQPSIITNRPSASNPKSFYRFDPVGSGQFDPSFDGF